MLPSDSFGKSYAWGAAPLVSSLFQSGSTVATLALKAGEVDAALEEAEVERAGGLLVALCAAAEKRYGLHVGECDAPGAPSRWGPVHNKVHAPGSYHYRHRAADISGLGQNMSRFANWVEVNYIHHIAELIHNPGYSVKNGKRVPPSFWGPATWAAHRNHVHLAI